MTREAVLKLAAALIFPALSAACVHDIRLDPVAGPLSRQVPTPTVIVVHSAAAFSVRFVNGEVCRGDGSDFLVGTVSESPLAQEWDTVYGAGFFRAHVLGISIHRTIMVGDRGTTVVLENGQVTPESKGSLLGVGVAKDSRGNVYRLSY
jgi:hypothetical protein